MAIRQRKQDTDTRQGVFLVVALIVGAMLLGAAIQFIWQRYYAPENPKGHDSRYLSLGEQAIRIGDHSVLIKLTVEYTGLDTENALRKALPKLQGQVTNRMHQIQTSDLRKLRTTQGKQQLADDVLVRVQDALPDGYAQDVKGILYEKFLIGE